MAQNIMVDLSLLKHNQSFRTLITARGISLLGLGFIAVSMPIQIFMLTGSSVCVGIAAFLDSIGMFAGLLLGGLLADRYDRRVLILFARSTCGIGFAGLALNAGLATPSVLLVYGLSLWDGFFGALGLSALAAAMPLLVGRAHLVQASAIGLLVTRCATIVSPAAAGAVIAAAGLTTSYVVAAIGTLLTIFTLAGLPPLVPSRSGADHPLRSLGAAFAFLGRQRRLLAIFGVGTVLTLTASVRIAFPALVIGPLGGGAREIGLMYTAVPLGAVLGAVSSGWVQHVGWPERALSILCAIACAALVLLGVSGHIAVALGALVIYGYASSVAGLVQYVLIQQHTPDRLLGRINSLGMAQDVVGDSLGVLGVGALVAWLPTCGITLLGLLALVIGGSLALPLTSGRRGADLTARQAEG